MIGCALVCRYDLGRGEGDLEPGSRGVLGGTLELPGFWDAGDLPCLLQLPLLGSETR